MACAVYLKKLCKDVQVTIVERGDRLGKKLSATGNGQGNLTNVNVSADKYFSSDKQLVEEIIGKYDSALDLFDCLFIHDGAGRVYPSGKQASSLTDNFIHKINKSGVKVMLSTTVTEIEGSYTVTLSNGKQLKADAVVMCVGGKAQKQFGTDGSSYSLVELFGHKTTRLYPSLVQIKTDIKDIKTLRGIRVDCVATAIVDGKEIKSFRGDVIFTEYGLSGNAIFSLSPYLVGYDFAKIKLEFLPDLSEADIQNIVERRKKSGYPSTELLSGSLHNQLGRVILKKCDSDNSKTIAAMVKAFCLDVYGNLGFDYAQVTRGGIMLDGVSHNLESKFMRNLYFAGEVLNVDGECGGYNLHWAFKSGMKVAESIADKINER